MNDIKEIVANVNTLNKNIEETAEKLPAMLEKVPVQIPFIPVDKEIYLDIKGTQARHGQLPAADMGRYHYQSAPLCH